MLKPKDITIKDAEGVERHYIISKFDAVTGREIVVNYSQGFIPKIGNYQTNEEMMYKIISHVAVRVGDHTIKLDNVSLIKSHVPDFETLMKLEWYMMEYNVSFLANGGLSSILNSGQTKLQELIASTLMRFSQQSTAKDTPPSAN